MLLEPVLLLLSLLSSRAFLRHHAAVEVASLLSLLVHYNHMALADNPTAIVPPLNVSDPGYIIAEVDE